MTKRERAALEDARDLLVPLMHGGDDRATRAIEIIDRLLNNGAAPGAPSETNE